MATVRQHPAGSARSTASSAERSNSITTSSVPVVKPYAAGTYRVATTALDVVNPAVTSSRRALPVTVWFPAALFSTGHGTGRFRPPFPLLVFSQGYDVPVPAFGALIDDWASAGFVVAGPTYPRTDASDPAGLDESDIVNHPSDLRAVVSAVISRAEQPGSPLRGLVDAAAVGLVGQSDGGDVSLAVAENSCCRDPRVKAAAVLSGAELASFGGVYFAAPRVPLLVVQGTADTINPPGCSVQTYDHDPGSKYYLDLLGAGHLPPYIDVGTDQLVVARVTTDFFAVELGREPGRTAAMASDGDVSGVAQLSDGGTAPLPVGPCPGAPP